MNAASNQGIWEEKTDQYTITFDTVRTPNRISIMFPGSMEPYHKEFEAITISDIEAMRQLAMSGKYPKRTIMTPYIIGDKVHVVRPDGKEWTGKITIETWSKYDRNYRAYIVEVDEGQILTADTLRDKITLIK